MNKERLATLAKNIVDTIFDSCPNINLIKNEVISLCNVMYISETEEDLHETYERIKGFLLCLYFQNFIVVNSYHEQLQEIFEYSLRRISGVN